MAMICEKNGTCYIAKNGGVLSVLVESLSAGTPFSAFLLAVELTLCAVFCASLPITRKDPIFVFLAIVFAPFIVKTSVEVAFFVSIYFYTSSYTFWSWVHDSVVSYCYSSFLFNFQYGMTIYTLQRVKVAFQKKPLSKGATIWPYLLVFAVTLVQAVFFWQIAIIGVASILLILIFAPVSIVVVVFCSIFFKTNGFSEFEEVRSAKSRMLWNIPCLIIAMSDSFSQLYLVSQSSSLQANAFHNKDLLFAILFPAFAIIALLITLPALRQAILPCCYFDTTPNNDRMFLLPRESVSGSPALSERSSISATQPIVTFPNNSAMVPRNSVAPMYPYYPMSTGFPQGGYSSAFQGQPMFIPVPMTYYNPHQMAMRPQELPVVQ